MWDREEGARPCPPLSLAQSAEESGGLGAPRSVATIFSPHSMALAGPGHPPWILRTTEHPQGWVGQASHGDSTRWGRSRWLGWGLDTHSRGTRMSRGTLISYHHSVNTTTAANSARPVCWQYILSHHSEESGGHREHTASRPCHTFQALASLEERLPGKPTNTGNAQDHGPACPQLGALVSLGQQRPPELRAKLGRLCRAERGRPPSQER